MGKALLLFCSLLILSLPAHASEKQFIVKKLACYFAGGQVWVNEQQDFYYSEILGGTQPTSGELCLSGFLGTRMCKRVDFYNFRLSCRDGSATLPQLFMALFGKDSETITNGFALSGNQLSYVDPANGGRRINLPPGYAPMVGIEGAIKRLTWDDVNQRPVLAKSITNEQEQRVRDLFTVRTGRIEPFPESAIQRAVAISLEKPKPPPVAVAPQVTPKESPKEKESGGIHISPDSYGALGIGFMFVAFIAWVSAAAHKVVRGGHTTFWRNVSIESVASVISSSVLYSLGVVTEIKWLSIPILGGLFSLVLTSSPKHT